MMILNQNLNPSKSLNRFPLDFHNKIYHDACLNNGGVNRI